jgi:hypothetical protein
LQGSPAKKKKKKKFMNLVFLKTQVSSIGGGLGIILEN